MSIIIQAQNLTKRYAGFLAVDHINFEIQEGQCFGFLGPNGAGKSSTLKMIYCFSSVTDGDLWVLGKNVTREASAIKREMGVVPQEDNLDPDLSVFDNLLIYANYFDIPHAEAKKRAEELLDFLQLSEKKKEHIKKLSGGMKRRLVIARALINKPKILILDEPTTGLDPQARHLIWNKLRSLKKLGVTLVLTTHYMEEAAQLCDTLVMMDKGKILTQGLPSVLVKEWVGNEVYEIRAPKPLLESLSARFVQEAFECERGEEVLYVFVREGQKINEELHQLFAHHPYLHRMANLEDVFLRVAGRDLKEF
ncbi:MAG: ATP-binding cassette domain-containing protein [Deltaproteobacteria bacterium]|nr:ATP-binding cassette domain-containing protein [Deltaproteobacteria bacterium]